MLPLSCSFTSFGVSLRALSGASCDASEEVFVFRPRRLQNGAQASRETRCATLALCFGGVLVTASAEASLEKCNVISFKDAMGVVVCAVVCAYVYGIVWVAFCDWH